MLPLSAGGLNGVTAERILFSCASSSGRIWGTEALVHPAFVAGAPHTEHVPALALHPVGTPPDAGERRAAVGAGGEARAHEDGDARVEVLDAAEHLEPLLLPVDGGEEAEVGAAQGGAGEARGRLPLLEGEGHGDEGAVHGRLDGELLAETRGRVGGGQRRHFVSAAAGRRSPVFWKCATCSCSLSSPYISESGVGGQPGT